MAAERFRHQILTLLPITALRSKSDRDDAVPDIGAPVSVDFKVLVISQKS
jgi:hypothetical protein